MNRHYTRINWEDYPSMKTAVNARNLNNVDLAVYTIDGELINHDNRLATDEGNISKNATDISANASAIETLGTTKANEQDYQTAIVSVDYNTTTGLWTFVQRDGTTFTFDQNVEKVPVDFKLSKDGILTMETADGTKFTADIGSMIKQYTFSSTSTVAFTTTTDKDGNKTVKADIVGHSIGAEQLQVNYLDDCQQAVTNATQQATNSSNSSKDSEAWAKGTKDNIPVEEGTQQYQNNAKYYAEQAREIIGSGIATPTQLGLVKPDGTTITVDADGTIHGAEQKEFKAENVTYDNAESGLESKDVQEAIDELAQRKPVNSAKDVTYDNSTSELEAENVQDAIDETVNAINDNAIDYSLDDTGKGVTMKRGLLIPPSGKSNTHQYSEDEKVVGKWVDNANVYERTIVIDALDGAMDNLLVDEEIGVVIYTYMTFMPPIDTDYLPVFGSVISTDGVGAFVQKQGDRKLHMMRSGTDLWIGWTAYITIQYTK